MDITREDCKITPQLNVVSAVSTLKSGPVSPLDAKDAAPKATRPLSTFRPLSVLVAAIAALAPN